MEVDKLYVYWVMDFPYPLVSVTCVDCVGAERWAWKKNRFRWWRGCADLVKPKGFKLAVITDERNGQPYLGIQSP